MLGVLASIAIVLGLAASLLWFLEYIVKQIGPRNVWLLLLVVFPISAGSALAYCNRDELVWWQMLLYSLTGPVVVAGLLLMGFAAVNPFAVITLIRQWVGQMYDRIIKRTLQAKNSPH